MTKTRIIERTAVDGRVKFVIQQKHMIFRWCWVDAWVINSMDSFATFEEAKKNLCHFDGSTVVDRVVHES